MIFSYGTKKYYEHELAKAKFIETAIKKHVKETLSRGDNSDDAEVLQCYAELIEEAQTTTAKMQTLYENSLKKEEETTEETDNG